MSGFLRRLTFIDYIVIAVLGLASGFASAHSEHDKGRFVAQHGNDNSDCKNRFRPCKTIAYANRQAKKGDKIFVASGQYEISSPLELISLSNSLNPVFGGYSTVDNYQVQNTTKNTTTLIGVPAKYRAMAQQQGFDVIVDSKSLSFNQALAKAEHQIEATQSRQTDIACVDGQADVFSCDNVSLISHMPLSDFTASRGSDIWGHYDLNTGTEYAIMGLRDGVAVVNLANPENPELVGKITQQSTTWRDIKVLQYFDYNINQWQAYAYVTADNASVGLTIVDLNNLPASISVANTDTTDSRAHNVYISNVDYGLNIANSGQPGLHILGAENFSGAMRTYSLTDPVNPTTVFSPSNANALLYTHDASSLTITDERAQTDCVNAFNSACNLMLDFNESEVRLWDHTDLSKTEALSTFTYPTASYVHSGWWSEDKNYIFVHDETDELSLNLNTTLYVFDITDLRNPQPAGTWTGPTNAIDHNGYVRGNRYYMSNYERGLVILDITDPTQPQSVGHFDTYPLSDNSSFSGAWGVYPYLPSGLILVSDINSGLYVFRDETRQQQVGFTATDMLVEEGESIDIMVRNTAGNSSINYEVFSGSASVNDYNLSNGTLTWEEGDSADKAITISITNDTDDSEPTESLFIRLMNPTNGTTLTNNSLIQIRIPGDDSTQPPIEEPPVVINRGFISFTTSELTVRENDTSSITAELRRAQGSDGPLTINYQFSDTEQNDVQVEGESVSWEDGDTGTKIITFNVIDDQESETQESYQLQLSSEEPLVLTTPAIFNLTILDDDSNQPASVSLTIDSNEGVNRTARIISNAIDPEGQVLTYLWEQTDGPAISVQDPGASFITFTAPTLSITMRLTVTDFFGVQTSAEITMEPVLNSTNNNPPATPATSSGGGSLPISALMLLILMVLSRRFIHISQLY